MSSDKVKNRQIDRSNGQREREIQKDRQRERERDREKDRDGGVNRVAVAANRGRHSFLSPSKVRYISHGRRSTFARSID